MNRSTICALVVGVGVLCTSWRAMADAAGDYQALFGEEEKAAARSAQGSVEFAAKLLHAARSIPAQKELQALLCEKAYEFGMAAPAGYQVAAEAMKLLIAAASDNKAQAREKLLKVSGFLYARSSRDERTSRGQDLLDVLMAAGDDRAKARQLDEAIALYRRALSVATAIGSVDAQVVIDRIKELAAAQESERRVADLKARLAQHPDSAAIRSALILACLAELDDPNEAARLVTPDVDEGLRTYVPLAARKVEDLAEGVCLDLAGWYVATAEKVSSPGKEVLLVKAQTCCERYLDLHQNEDVSRLKAKMLLAEVDKALEAAGRPARRIALALGGDVTMELVRIPAGKFVMGSPETEPDREGSEGPQRLVTISRPFYIGVTEVTQAQFEAVMGSNPAKHKGPDNPVDNATWHEAAEFCEKLSRKTGKTVRLPTEAQWEYACRAGTRTTFFFGDDPERLTDYAWFEQNSGHTTHPVGRKKPNPAGLYDIHGNVWEWCSDWYADSYAKAGTVDPQGPDSGTRRVWRGGSWFNSPKYLRSACRLGDDPDNRRGHRGFRVVVALSGN